MSHVTPLTDTPAFYLLWVQPCTTPAPVTLFAVENSQLQLSSRAQTTDAAACLVAKNCASNVTDVRARARAEVQEWVDYNWKDCRGETAVARVTALLRCANRPGNMFSGYLDEALQAQPDRPKVQRKTLANLLSAARAVPSAEVVAYVQNHWHQIKGETAADRVTTLVSRSDILMDKPATEVYAALKMQPDSEEILLHVVDNAMSKIRRRVKRTLACARDADGFAMPFPPSPPSLLDLNGLTPVPSPAPSQLDLNGLTPVPSPAPSQLDLNGLTPVPSPAPSLPDFSELSPLPSPSSSWPDFGELTPLSSPAPSLFDIDELTPLPSPAPSLFDIDELTPLPSPAPSLIDFDELTPVPSPAINQLINSEISSDSLPLLSAQDLTMLTPVKPAMATAENPAKKRAR